MLEEVNDMREEVYYLQAIEDKIEKLLSQLDPYEFDMHIKRNNSIGSNQNFFLSIINFKNSFKKLI